MAAFGKLSRRCRKRCQQHALVYKPFKFCLVDQLVYWYYSKESDCSPFRCRSHLYNRTLGGISRNHRRSQQEQASQRRHFYLFDSFVLDQAGRSILLGGALLQTPPPMRGIHLETSSGMYNRRIYHLCPDFSHPPGSRNPATVYNLPPPWPIKFRKNCLILPPLLKTSTLNINKDELSSSFIQASPARVYF